MGLLISTLPPTTPSSPSPIGRKMHWGGRPPAILAFEAAGSHTPALTSDQVSWHKPTHVGTGEALSAGADKTAFPERKGIKDHES